MSFSIAPSGPGLFRVSVDGALEGATIGLFRSELALVLAARPDEVVLSLRQPERLDGAGWGLLRSFFDVLRARGGRIVLDFGSEQVVVVRDLPHLMRLLAQTLDRGQTEPGFSASK